MSSAGPCDQCRARPKFVENGKTHPYCGRTCAYAANTAPPPKPKDAMCKQCRQRPCHKEPSGKIHPFCGQNCADEAANGNQGRRKEPKTDAHKSYKGDNHSAHHGVSSRKKGTYNTGSGSSSRPIRSSPRKSGGTPRAQG